MTVLSIPCGQHEMQATDSGLPPYSALQVDTVCRPYAFPIVHGEVCIQGWLEEW